MSLPNGCKPADGVLDGDGRCRMSDLPPEQCGLKCHRGVPDLPVVDDTFDDGRRL